MTKIIGCNNKKDELFYSDLAYKIRQIANLELIEDETIEKRIKLREEIVTTRANEITDFHLALLIFVAAIEKETQSSFKSLKDIEKYPNLVKEALKDIEEYSVKTRVLK